MKIKDGYILKNIAGSYVVFSLNDKETESNLISLNETGAFLFKKLQNDITTAELLDELLSEFSVDELRAKEDIAVFLNKCKEIGVLDD